MIAPGIFHKWVPNFVRIPALLVLYIVALDCKGVYQGNTTDIFSDLGVYSESYTAAYNALYIGMGIGFMVHMRLAARFPVKTLILYGLIVQLLMHAVCAISAYPLITILACLMLGFGKAAAVKELYNFWAAIWSKEGDRGRIYPFVFTVGLAGTFLLYWAMTRLAFSYNWQYAYVPIITGLAVCVLLACILFESHPLPHPLPLHQMDWPGVALLALGMMLVNYISVYGQVEDWLNSFQIRCALALAPAVTLGFFLREATVRRPMMPLKLLSVPNYLPGLFFFLTTGLYVPAAVQFLYSQEVLRLELTRAVQLNLYLIPGVVAGATGSWLWYRLKLPAIPLICAGMLACITYNILFYRQLTAAEGLQDFWLPSLFKGFGICILYIALGIYTTQNIPLKDLPAGIGFLILIRSFLGRGVFSAIFTYLLYATRIRHLEILATQLDPAWRYRWHPGPNSRGYIDFMNRQAYLAAARQLTGGIILTGLVVLLALIAWATLRQTKTTRNPL